MTSVFRVFLASPGDVPAERNALSRVVDEVNVATAPLRRQFESTFACGFRRWPRVEPAPRKREPRPTTTRSKRFGRYGRT
jgi:hypothetical protein